MTDSSYGKDSIQGNITLTGNINITGDLRNKGKVFNKINTPSLTFSNQSNYNITELYKYYTLSLSNSPLTETTVLNTSSLMDPIFPSRPVTVTVTLPAITDSIVGMTFNFIKTNILSFVIFKTSSNDKIIIGQLETNSVTLLKHETLSVQLIAISNKWLVMSSSLPQQITNPAGSIITMSYMILPQGYLYCDGQSYVIEYYPDLYGVIGYTYGSNYSDFRVPNFNNGSFLRGYLSGTTSEIGTQQTDNIKEHTHSVYTKTYQPGTANGRVPSMISSTGTYQSDYFNSGPNTKNIIDETRPKNYAVYYCIKY